MKKYDRLKKTIVMSLDIFWLAIQVDHYETKAIHWSKKMLSPFWILVNSDSGWFLDKDHLVMS